MTADALTALAYYSIPLALVIFAVKRRDLRYKWVVYLFAAFVVACGSTHVLSIVTLWEPAYYLQGWIKLGTAAISVVTAVLLWPLIPKVLALPSPADLEREVAERMAAEQEVRSINRGLEQRVLDRTRALERAKDEAIRANQAKTRFLAAASHDLRQPFQALRLFFEVLDQRLADHAVRPVLDMAKQALDGGESLLHALLDISTLQAGTVKIRPVRFVVDEVLQQVANEMGPTAAAKGIVLRVVPCRTEVVNDPVLVKRLVRNLVSNAVRYTDRGRILLGCRRSGGRVRIEVWDTGIGIPESARQEIFEEFTQLGNPERDRTKGLGLGLAIVRRLAQLLDTELDLDSEVGRGTVFRVTLPHTLPAGAPMPEEIGA